MWKLPSLIALFHKNFQIKLHKRFYFGKYRFSKHLSQPKKGACKTKKKGFVLSYTCQTAFQACEPGTVSHKLLC